MSSNALRIAYFGLPLGALALARAGFSPQVVVLGHADAPGARRVRAGWAPQSLVLKPRLERLTVVETIAAAQPDVILSWFFPRRIPEAILRLAPRGAFGVHPSLLPRWRGPDPYFWAIYTGDRTTGVTLHRLDGEYDTGCIVEQRRLEISAHESAWRLAKRLDRPGLRLLVECAERLAAGELLLGAAQDETQASSAPQPDEELLSIDWKRSADEIVRLVRAASPYPGASAELGRSLVDVLEAERYAGELPRVLEPTEAVRTPEGLVVRAADQGVLLRCVRDEAGVVLREEALFALFPEGLSRVGFGAGASMPRSDRTTE
jgi:methionyl-tRNA formyltransferase